MKHFIPKFHKTIQYIIYGLEEIERDDIYRIKLIQHKRLRQQKTMEPEKTEKEQVCPLCKQNIGSRIILQSEEDEHLPEKQDKMEDKFVEETRLYGRPKIEPSNRIYIPISSQSCQTMYPLKSVAETNTEMVINILKKHLNDVIFTSKMFLESGFGIKDFVQACKDAKARIEQFFSPGVPTEVDDRLNIKLNNLKTHLRQVMEITKELRNDTFLSPSVEDFARICEKVDSTINSFMKRVESQSQPVTDDVAKSHLHELKSQIEDVVQLTEKYQEQGLLKPSIEKFLHSCEVAKSKIDLYTKEKEIVDNDQIKLDQLKTHLKNLEVLAADVKHEGLTSSSFDNFVISCTELKKKLDDYKNRGKKPPAEGGLQLLVSQLDETISLSKEAKKSGLISESIDDFIKSCEHTKTKIKILEEEKITEPEQPKVLDELKYSIDDVIRMVNKCQAEGLVTKSIENFIESLEIAKDKIEASKRSTDSEFRIILPSCGEACICDGLYDELNNSLEKQLQETSFTSCLMPPCGACQEVEKTPVDVSENITGTNYINPTEEWPEYVSPELSEDISEMCEFCKQNVKEEKEEDVTNKSKPELVDSTLGYFKKKVRKITKVTRTQNTDGTIREEKETITIKKMKYDPTETSFSNDDEYGTASDETLLEMDETIKPTGESSEQNQRCCFGRSTSECCARVTTVVTPKRKNISITDFRFF